MHLNRLIYEIGVIVAQKERKKERQRLFQDRQQQRTFDRDISPPSPLSPPQQLSNVASPSPPSPPTSIESQFQHTMKAFSSNITASTTAVSEVANADGTLRHWGKLWITAAETASRGKDFKIEGVGFVFFI